MSFRLLRRLLPALALASSVACFDDKDDDDDDDDDDEDSGYDWTTTTGYYGTTGTGTTTGTTGTSMPTASVDWGSSAVVVDVSGGAGGWWFGMAEVAGCDDCWTGEDCVFGYEYSGGVLAWCHDAGDTGTTLTYGGDPIGLNRGTTAFSRSADGDVAYFLESDMEYGGDGSCWVWGADPTYYDGLGCTAL
jgi:hypothetical protein